MLISSKYSDLLKNLQNGNICVFETDTVVGIGCTIYSNLLNINSNLYGLNNKEINSNINKIFKIKKRSTEKKLPILISSVEMLKKYTKNIQDYAWSYIKNYWPGNLTLILEANDNISEFLCVKQENKNTIAFRMPNSNDLLNAIEEINCPIACTSANISEQFPSNKIDDVSNEILSKVDFVYSHQLEENESKKPSKIISCITENPVIIRE